MENRNEILDELRQISPIVADIAPKNLLKVPENYFERFAGDLMVRIHSMRAGEAFPPLSTMNKEMPLSAPPVGYFEGFAEKMLQAAKASRGSAVDEELAEISPVLSKLKKEMPFTLPQGYFENFSIQVVESARAIDAVHEELTNLSPVMIGLNNKSTYTTPQGYFENFPGNVLSAIKTESKKAKVFSIGSRRTWLRVAAAAIVVGVITTVSYYAINKNDVAQGVSDPVAALSKISDDEMVNYLQNQDMPVLDSTINQPIASIDLSPDGDKGHDLLNNVTDEELQQYIKEDISYKDDDTN